MESTVYDTGPEDLKIIETLRFDPVDGFIRLALHVDRAEATAAMLGFGFDRAVFLQTLGGAVADDPLRCRVTVDRAGGVDVTVAQFASVAGPWRVAVSDTAVQADDPWLQVKTTQRGLYDQVRADIPAGIDEVVFLNAQGHLCEGTITNLFLERKGHLWTPPTKDGVLPGVLRAEMLAQGIAAERVLTLDDWARADRVFLGNSLRGLIPAELVEA